MSVISPQHLLVPSYVVSISNVSVVCFGLVASDFVVVADALSKDPSLSDCFSAYTVSIAFS